MEKCTGFSDKIFESELHEDGRRVIKTGIVFCANRKKCQRHTMPPGHWQSYMVPPDGFDGGGCEFYLEATCQKNP